MSEPARGTEQSARNDVLEALNEMYSGADTVGPARNGASPPPPPPRPDEPTQDSVEEFSLDLENFAIDLSVELSGPEFGVRGTCPVEGDRQGSGSSRWRSPR
jgi:hypothetical protein